MEQDMIWRGKVLTGCAISSGNARLAEVAARVGFDVVWIEMEHASSDLAGAELSCQNPELIELVARCIRRAREAGLHAGILAAPGPLLDNARQTGADLCIFATDIGSLVAAWQQQLEQWMQCERARPG